MGWFGRGKWKVSMTEGSIMGGFSEAGRRSFGGWIGARSSLAGDFDGVEDGFCEGCARAVVEVGGGMSKETDFWGLDAAGFSSAGAGAGVGVALGVSELVISS